MTRGTDKNPWLVGMIAYYEGQAAMCYHRRQLCNCAVCAPEAERRYLEWKAGQDAKSQA